MSSALELVTVVREREAKSAFRLHVTIFLAVVTWVLALVFFFLDPPPASVSAELERRAALVPELDHEIAELKLALERVQHCQCNSCSQNQQ